MLTQTDVIQFIHEHLDSIKLDFASTQSITELGLMGPKSLVTMSKNETAFDGYVKMKKNRVLALPVVDEQGKLVASLSNSHLRGLNAERLETLSLPVVEFLAVRSSSHVS